MTAPSDRTLTEDGVTAATAQALRTAMHRLLTGAERHTDGRLTKQNLWQEAGVSRATMNRAHTILAEWDDHIAQRSTADPELSRRDDEIDDLLRIDENKDSLGYARFMKGDSANIQGSASP